MYALLYISPRGCLLSGPPEAPTTFPTRVAAEREATLMNRYAAWDCAYRPVPLPTIGRCHA